MSRLVSRLSIDGDRVNWRVLAVVTAVILLFVAVVSVILTAPVSELKVYVRNTDESDTAIVTITLGESAVSLNVLPGQMLVWKFHVSPGTHSLEASCTYDVSGSYYGPSDDDDDYDWTMHVGFMCVNHHFLLVSEEATSIDGNPPSILEGSHPLSQALEDPNVVVPAAVLSGLVVLVVVALWNLFRVPPQTNPKRPTGPT